PQPAIADAAAAAASVINLQWRMGCAKRTVSVLTVRSLARRKCVAGASALSGAHRSFARAAECAQLGDIANQRASVALTFRRRFAKLHDRPIERAGGPQVVDRLLVDAEHSCDGGCAPSELAFGATIEALALALGASLALGLGLALGGLARG